MIMMHLHCFIAGKNSHSTRFQCEKFFCPKIGSCNFKSWDDLIKALDPPAAVDALAGRAGAHLAPLGLGLVAVRLHLRLER